jgi:hypothetical protein
MTETLLQKLERSASQKSFEKFSKQSFQWYKDRVRTLGGDRTRRELLKDAQAARRFRASPRPGYMYTFIYDAKHKDTLPYFDAFPLIIMVGPAEGGFTGLNLHYLPPKYRALLFDELLKVMNNSSYTDRTKLNITYQLLNASAKYKLFKPTFKRYLMDHMQSKLVFIPSSEWEAAMFLPIADFQGASNSKVWSDSLFKAKT